MASAFMKDHRIAIGYIGEGTTAEGDFHEALTFAAVYRAPVILAITNNQWAISTFSGIAGADQTTFAAKAIGYGLPGLRVDGNDFLAVVAATQWAAERARKGEGPTLLELETYRFCGHSRTDPGHYRPPAEVQYWKERDPIVRYERFCLNAGLASQIEIDELKKSVEKELDDAVAFAQSSPDPKPEDCLTDVYA